MKNNIKSIIKIYIIMAAYTLITCITYSLLLVKSTLNSNIIIELIIGSISYLLLGLLYSNFIHKHGIWIGILSGISHILLVKIIYFLAGGTFQIALLKSIIFILFSAIGGILGIFFKKII